VSVTHRVDRQHVCTDRGGLNREDNLHHIARREFEQVLDRTIGLEWRLLREVELEQSITMPDRDTDPAIVQHQPELDL
jgi:hypothetical protein